MTDQRGYFKSAYMAYPQGCLVAASRVSIAGGEIRYDPAPERKGVIAVRERREPEGRLMSGVTDLTKFDGRAD